MSKSCKTKARLNNGKAPWGATRSKHKKRWKLAKDKRHVIRCRACHTTHCQQGAITIRFASSVDRSSKLLKDGRCRSHLVTWIRQFVPHIALARSRSIYDATPIPQVETMWCRGMRVSYITLNGVHADTANVANALRLPQTGLTVRRSRIVLHLLLNRLSSEYCFRSSSETALFHCIQRQLIWFGV